jgi:hypothetical protein
MAAPIAAPEPIPTPVAAAAFPHSTAETSLVLNFRAKSVLLEVSSYCIAVSYPA